MLALAMLASVSGILPNVSGMLANGVFACESGSDGCVIPYHTVLVSMFPCSDTINVQQSQLSKETKKSFQG